MAKPRDEVIRYRPGCRAGRDKTHFSCLIERATIPVVVAGISGIRGIFKRLILAAVRVTRQLNPRATVPSEAG